MNYCYICIAITVERRMKFAAGCGDSMAFFRYLLSSRISLSAFFMLHYAQHDVFSHHHFTFNTSTVHDDDEEQQQKRKEIINK